MRIVNIGLVFFRKCFSKIKFLFMKKSEWIRKKFSDRSLFLNKHKSLFRCKLKKKKNSGHYYERNRDDSLNFLWRIISRAEFLIRNERASGLPRNAGYVHMHQRSRANFHTYRYKSLQEWIKKKKRIYF